MPLACPLTTEEFAAATAAFAGSDPAQIRGWQARLGVEADGRVGPLTRDALEENRPEGVASRLLEFNGHRDGSATRYSLREHGPDFRLGENFRLVEFASRDGADEVLVHPALVALLETVREHFGEPVTVNSGYRSPAHNRRIGGARNSRHVMGLAADIVVDKGAVSPRRVATYVETLDPGGLGRYNTFTHVDVQGKNRRWSG